MFDQDRIEIMYDETVLPDSEERCRCILELESPVGEAIVTLEDNEQGKDVQTFATDA